MAPQLQNSKSLELLTAHKRILELMAKNCSLEEILNSITKVIETLAPDCQAAVYFVTDNKLQLGAAPSFPVAFTEVVDGCPVGANHGVCGTAGFTGERTISTNVALDKVWGTFTDWVLSFGIKAAFSTPVLSKEGEVIATVSLYYQKTYEPTPWDFEIVEVAANLMSIAVERKKQDEMIMEQRLKLATSSKLAALGEMSANLAHELNNPLAIIQNHLTYLRLLAKKEALSMEAVLTTSENIEKTVLRMATIIKGLKLISKDGDTELVQRFSLNSLINDTLSFCRERFKTNEIELRVDTVPENLLIQGRPVQLSQALLNLLNNSFDAIAKLPLRWIQIGVELTGDTCLLFVMDSGTGVPSDVRNKIMHPFFTTKGMANGTGLGLSITQKIIESHNGTLILNENSPNTRFDLKLPLGLPT